MDLRRTPFHDAHVAAGARMVPFAGFDMPVQYAGIAAEHQAVRERAGLFDVSHMGELRFRGARALDTLQWLCTNDVAQCPVGEAMYAVLCNERGGCVDDIFIYRLADDDFLVVVNASNRDKDREWVIGHNPHPDGCTITDEGDDWALLAVQGPAAVAVVASIGEIDVTDIPRRGVVAGVTVAGVEGCLLARTGYTGEDGFEIFAPSGVARPLWDAVVEAGASVGLIPCGLGARDTLRLEVRNCLYGHELDDDTSPLQARLHWVVKLDKPGGFIGRDAIAARRDSDTHWLAGLVVDGKRIPRDGMRVLKDGQDIGWVTSGTRGPSTGTGIALAYLAKPNGKPGNHVIIDVRGREAEATVIKGPFYAKDSE